MNKSTNTVDLAAGIRRMDEYVVHPWESFDAESVPNTVINSGGGVYVYDSDGNRLLDGPGGIDDDREMGHPPDVRHRAEVEGVARVSLVDPYSSFAEDNLLVPLYENALGGLEELVIGG